MKPTTLKDAKASDPLRGSPDASQGSGARRGSFQASQRAAAQPGPQPLSHPVDPYTAALQEAQDGDGDIERATRGRLGPGSAKEDEAEAGPGPLQTQASEIESGGTAGGRDKGDDGQARGVRATERAGAAAAGDAPPALSPGERHSQSMLTTVNLDQNAVASVILMPAYQNAAEALSQPIMQRDEQAGARLNDLQMRATGTGG